MHQQSKKAKSSQHHRILNGTQSNPRKFCNIIKLIFRSESKSKRHTLSDIKGHVKKSMKSNAIYLT